MIEERKNTIEINRIYNENNIITMSKIPDKFVSGVITSPPYNQCSVRTDGYYNNGYSEIDNLSEEDYLEIRLNEFKQFERILKDDGCICYNISYQTENPILPTLLVTEVHQKTGLTLVDIISWKKPNSIPFQGSAQRLSRICELIYVFAKKENVRTFKTNKEVSKINEKTGQKFYKGYVNYIEAKNNDGIKCNLKASYSTDLVSKLIHIYYPKGSLIYDPFSGIGTTTVACRINGLNYLGSELNKEFFDIAIDRLK